MTTPREVVERYNYEFWNECRFELADELLADHVVRHEVGTVDTLTRNQARERVESLVASVTSAHFTLLNVIADGDHVCIVYQCDLLRQDGTPDTISSIEVFRVVDGRITDVWNNPHTRGAWS